MTGPGRVPEPEPARQPTRSAQGRSSRTVLPTILLRVGWVHLCSDGWTTVKMPGRSASYRRAHGARIDFGHRVIPQDSLRAQPSSYRQVTEPLSDVSSTTILSFQMI